MPPNASSTGPGTMVISCLLYTSLVANDHVWGYMGVDLVDRTMMWSNEDVYKRQV